MTGAGLLVMLSNGFSHICLLLLGAKSEIWDVSISSSQYQDSNLAHLLISPLPNVDVRPTFYCKLQEEKQHGSRKKAEPGLVLDVHTISQVISLNNHLSSVPFSQKKILLC